jgi:hypothetical protein
MRSGEYASNARSGSLVALHRYRGKLSVIAARGQGEMEGDRSDHRRTTGSHDPDD